jgi:tetratricopeptide (TPR) repeat protein
LFLARSLLASGRAAAALEALGEAPAQGPAAVLRGEVLSALGRWDEAAEAFAAVPGFDALLRRASALRRAGRRDDARELLRPVQATVPGAAIELAEIELDRGDLGAAEKALRRADSGPEGPPGSGQRRELIEGRILLGRGLPAEAVGVFERLLARSSGAPDDLRAAAAVGLAAARAGAGGADAGATAAESFVAREPANPFLGPVFEALDRFYAAQENPPESALSKWAEEGESPRRALAAFYLALAEERDGKRERALRRLAKFVEEHRDHPLVGRAHALRARYLWSERRLAEARKAAEAAMRSARDDGERAAAEMVAGAIEFAAGEFVVAVQHFRNAGKHGDAFAELALFNAGLAWARQGNAERFAEVLSEIEARFPGSKLLPDLELEAALAQARGGGESAGESLRAFLARHPESKRCGEARLALAELAMLAPMPRIAESRQWLRVARASELPADAAERSDLMAIHLADAPERRDERAAIEAARAFLRNHPDSPLRADARMKLGEIQFRSGDFAAAETSFALLAKEDPDSPLAEGALYLAGDSALRGLNDASVERAIEHFDAVVRRNGPLKFAARQQQALAQVRRGRLAEALVLYDALIGERPAAAALRAALAGRAEVLMALAEKEPARWAEAAAAWETLAAAPEGDGAWAAQALYQKARCLDGMGRGDEALATLYAAVERGAGTGGTDYLWFYKAGFEAAQRLEKSGDVRSAIGVYRKIGTVQGPRAEEARARAEQLALERFVWE